jgi:putative membrane protein
MIALINWRRAQSRGQQVTPLGARSFGTISFVQAVLLVLMVVLATGMARGYGG